MTSTPGRHRDTLRTPCSTRRPAGPRGVIHMGTTGYLQGSRRCGCGLSSSGPSHASPSGPSSSGGSLFVLPLGRADGGKGFAGDGRPGSKASSAWGRRGRRGVHSGRLRPGPASDGVTVTAARHGCSQNYNNDNFKFFSVGVPRHEAHSERPRHRHGGQYTRAESIADAHAGKAVVMTARNAHERRHRQIGARAHTHTRTHHMYTLIEVYCVAT